MKNKQEHIYVIYDPTFSSNKIYVGKTISLSKRLYAHIINKQKEDTHKTRWIHKCLNGGTTPVIQSIYIVPENMSWKEAEKAFIAFFRWCGIELLNGTDGGEGLIGITEETRNKMSAAKITHNKSKIKEYKIWYDMMARCYKENSVDYAKYGKIGIIVCDRWQNYINFEKDIDQCLDGYMLARKDVTGNFTPDNVIFTTRIEAAKFRRNSHKWMFNNTEYSTAELATLLNINIHTIWTRITRKYNACKIWNAEVKEIKS